MVGSPKKRARREAQAKALEGEVIPPKKPTQPAPNARARDFKKKQASKPKELVKQPHGGALAKPWSEDNPPKRAPQSWIDLRREAHRLAKEGTPDAIKILLEMMKTAMDERARIVAAVRILDMTLGKPGEKSQVEEDRMPFDLTGLTADQLQQLRALLLAGQVRRTVLDPGE